MNIQVIGRIRPSGRGEGEALHRESSNRVAARAGGPYYGFQELYTPKSGTFDVFKGSVSNIVDLFLGGCNVCLLVAGESGSGKSYTLAGDGGSKAGLVPMVIDHMFARLTKDSHSSDRKNTLGNPRVKMQMFEVYNEIVKDLLEVNRLTGLELKEDAFKGVHVPRASSAVIANGTQGNNEFRQAWGRRTEASTDYGPSTHNASVFTTFELEVSIGSSPQPYKSKCTIVELPGLEKLSSDTSPLSLRQGALLNQALVALSHVVTDLGGKPYADRVVKYDESKVTQLLQEELGGNCHTRALFCLKPESHPDVQGAVLKFSNHLAQVKNFPIVNDYLAQSLLTQLRTKAIDLKHQAGSGPSMAAPYGGDADSEVRRLQTENLVLKDQNERLSLNVDQLKNKFGQVTSNKSDLSQQLLLSEEEKLKVSQSLVEMQIENNKIKEEAEATNFELTNKIILLENQLGMIGQEKDRHNRANKMSKERLQEMETDRKDLADEYVVLKTNYLALTSEHKKECTRNENLAIELLNLVNNKAALMKQVTILTNGDPSHVSDPSAEIARVRAIVNQNSSGKKADQILGSQSDRQQVEDRLFASQRKFQSEIERLKGAQDDEHKKTENRMTNLMKELADTRNLARERQQTISELNAKLITLRGEKEALDTQYNRMQHKLKDLGQDFRSRLVKYVEDIAGYMDKGSGVPGQQQEKKMREYVDNMLKDIRRAHREREDQLSQAAQAYRKRLQGTVHSYEKCLIAYRNLRQTAEMRGIDRADIGPPEDELRLGENEIQSSHLKELDRTKGELSKLKTELDAVKLRYGLFGDGKENFADLNSVSARSDLWGSLRKQLREFTLNTQQQLEQERARLLSENQVLGQQLKENQDYIDNHLVRYKQEILRLRQMLGMGEGHGNVVTPRGLGRRK